jgi:hypothetical protein
MRWQRAVSPNRLSLLVGSSRLMLIKIGFDGGRATLVIAIGVERGQNSLVTIARQPPHDANEPRNPWVFPEDIASRHALGEPSGKPWRARLCAETGRELPRPGARPATQRAASPPAEVRFAEVRQAEVRPAEARADIGVLIAPLVPGSHALLEHREVLVVRYGSTPEVWSVGSRCFEPT